ncbi:mechanosensitive ion channel [Candidatus Woesearchaeota archaeon]|nr:mechanosensitive ion channel [Candidatus Woesearchaeota archaeon]
MAIIEVFNKAYDFTALALLKTITIILTVLIGFIIGRFAGKLSYHLFRELEIDTVLSKATKRKFKLQKRLSAFIEFFVYFLTIITVLNQLGVTTVVLYFVAVTILLVIVVALIMGFKDLLPNAFAGYTLYRQKFFVEGDRIRVNEVEGKVISVSLLETKIETKKGDTILVPNSTLVKQQIVKKK